jgi:DNA-binding response OmpR family regulator
MKTNTTNNARWNYKMAFHYDLTARKRTVLMLITDDAAYAGAVKPVLVQAGFDVKVADCEPGADSAAFSVVPDVILVDRMMDGGENDSVLRRLKSQPHLEKIPVYTARQAAKQSAAAIPAGSMDLRFTAM